MAKILDEPLAKWRVFLHPSQRRLVEMDSKGPVRVLGGAGTGKTVVAIHRARWLAGLCKGDEKILFTTFTKNLAADIQENLRQLCNWDTLKKIEVIHLDAWAVSFLRKRGIKCDAAIGDHADELWQKAVQLSPDGAAFSSSFLREEWQQVIVAHGINTLADYFKASRMGRRKRLSRKDKQAIWPVFDEFRALLTENSLRELGDIHRDVRQLLEREKGARPYRSVVADESQDFGAEAFRLLRELAPKELGNDLFLVGDAHQRIYGHRVVLSQCGVEVRGRSRTLRINYRTTEETRRWAVGILRGIAIDDLDGGLADDKGYRSLTHGSPPKIAAFKTQDQEHHAIREHLESLLSDERNREEGICLVARTNKQVEGYQRMIQDAGFSTCLVKHGESDDQSRNAAYIEAELRSIEIPDQIRIQIELMCASLISTKHDVTSEVFELAELSATSSSSVELAPVVDRIIGWLQESIEEMHQVVQALEAGAQTNAGVDLCFVLIAESAINILSAWNCVESPALGSIPPFPQP